MANELTETLNPKLYPFKQEIGYENIIRNLPEERIVSLNWQDLLQVFEDTDHTKWKLSHPSIGMSYKRGSLTANIVSSDGEANIAIYSYNQNRKHAIDDMLWKATDTSAPFMSYKVSGEKIGDFCLVPRKSDNVYSIKYVYGNILVDIRHLNSDKDVLPVARYLQSAMEKAVAANPEKKLPTRPKITYSITPTQVRAGETFTVTLPTDYPNEQWDFGFAEELLTPNIVYDKKRMNILTLKAVSPGKGVVSFSLMDKKTLWVFTDTVTINIDPAK